MKKNIIKLFNIVGAIVDKIEVDSNVLIFARSPRVVACCPRCAKVTRKIHSVKKRLVQHDVFEKKKVILVIKVRRFKCKKCGPFTERNIPGVSRQKYTENFKNKTILLLKNTNFKEVANQCMVSAPTLVGFLKERKRQRAWPEGELILNIDEHSYRGRDLKITIGLSSHGELRDVLKDDRQTTLRQYLKNIPDEAKQRVSEACIDMKNGYIAPIKEALPKAKIVVDHFHVIKEMLRQMEEIRKILQDTKTRGKRINRFLLLKNREDLSVVEKLKLNEIFQQYANFPTLQNCYWLKEQMRDVYKCRDLKTATHKFDILMAVLEDEKFGKMKEMRDTLKRWRPYILNYFHSRTTNGFIEGCHNKIKLIKRMSYGFRNFTNYVLKITLAFAPFLFLNCHTIF